MHLQFCLCLVYPHLQGAGSQRCLVDNKVLQTHKRDEDIIYGDEVHLRRGELQIYIFVTSTDMSLAFLFNFSFPLPKSLPHILLLLSCPAFIPLFLSSSLSNSIHVLTFVALSHQHC